MIKTVLFDLDGTLIKSVDMILEVYQQMVHKYLKDVDLAKEDITEFLGRPLKDSFLKHTTDETLIDEIIKDYKLVTKNLMVNDLTTYDHAKEIIDWLKKKRIKIGIVTSKTRAVAFENLKTVGLLDVFDCFIGLEDCVNHKPDPEGILKAMDLLGSSKETTIYVGDHENDIIAAKKAEVLSCGVTYSYRLDQVLNARPDFVIDDLIHIKDLI